MAFAHACAPPADAPCCVPAAPRAAPGSALKFLIVVTRRSFRLRRVPAGPTFAAVFKNGARCKDALLLVCAAPNTQAHARLGVNVARKVASKAVARNRIKRQLRETFRHYQDDVANLDVVVIAQAGAGVADNVALRNALREHLKKIAHKCKKS